MQSISGKIERVFFSNDGWMAGVLRETTGSSTKFSGNVYASTGDAVTLHGDWTQHPKFGRQFTAERAEVKMDATPEGVARLLAADKAFEGIGPKRAKLIVDAGLALSSDGEAVTGMREKTVEVAERAGVPVKVVTLAVEVWTRNASNYAAVAALCEQGWTTGQAAKIVSTFGEGAANLVRSDPYMLVGKVERFGFRTVDTVARQLGIHSADPRRLRCGTIYCLEKQSEDGHTWTSREALIASAIAQLEPDTLEGEVAIDAIVDELIEGGEITTSVTPVGETVLSDTRLARAENAVFDFLRDGLANSIEPIDVSAPEVAAVLDRLNPGQYAAVEAFSRRRVAVISGGAGVGKTYTIKSIVDIARAAHIRVAVCAPTGKAAKRAALTIGGDASTIHRLLEPQFDGGEFAFTRNASNPLEVRLVIVDEASMVDVRLMHALIDALPDGARLVLVGDHHQIPSVGPGAIMRDILAARSVPRFADAVHVLTQVHRQAGELARNTQAILDGIVVSHGGPAWDTVNTDKGNESGAAQTVADVVEGIVTSPEAASFFDEPVGLDFGVQVLAPMRKGPLGTWALNARLQAVRQRLLGNPPPEPCAPDRAPKPLQGDRVLWTKNDYELGLMNGTQAIVKRILKGGAMEIETEDGQTKTIESGKRKHLEVAFAMTIHKSQGSEWPAVVLVVSGKHFIMRDRNLLYTGASRAAKSLTIVGDAVGIRSFAQEQKSDARLTLGAFMLADEPWQPGVALVA